MCNSRVPAVECIFILLAMFLGLVPDERLTLPSGNDMIM